MDVGKFREVKVDQKLWSVQLGDCKVVRIDTTTKDMYGRIICENANTDTCSYGFTGKHSQNHVEPSLYFSNPNENKFPKRMWVKDNLKDVPVEAIVLAKCDRVFVALDGEYRNMDINDIDVQFSGNVCSWAYADDIPPKVVKRLTLVEIAKLLEADEIIIVEEISKK
jgi:hypothetical protein